MRKRDANARFDEKVDRSNADGCWTWTGSLDSGGYGKFKVRSHVLVRASRFAFERAVGPIPEGMFVCHHCDNPSCVRPDHLFCGTHADNVRDMYRKGRHPGPPRFTGLKVPRPLKTHCKRGHEFSASNTYALATGKRIQRTCRECRRLREADMRMVLHRA